MLKEKISETFWIIIKGKTVTVTKKYDSLHF